MLLCYTITKVNLPNKFLSFWAKITENNIKAFVIISVISLIPFIGEGVSIGEDIGGQVKSSVQWLNGETFAPNVISEPDTLDLSVDQNNWSLRPPGVAILPVIGMIFQLPLGHSIQIALLVCSILGGLGWLNVFKEFKINKYIIFLVAIMLGLETGPTSTQFGTANIILYAIVPWFVLHVVKLGWYSKRPQFNFINYILLAIFLFFLGSFAWIKLSGIIVAGTIGASLYFMLLKGLNMSQKIQFTLLYGVLGISFWVPFLLLEKTNVFLTGISADELYGSIVNYEIESRLFGHNWCESTQNPWLVWSLIAALGYSLPIKVITHGLRDFFIQFEEFTSWTLQNSINEHVLLCGLIGIIFSIIVISKLKVSSPMLKSEHNILMRCFLILPFLGLAILSYRYEWNYLLYHAHTYEFWLIFCIPSFLAFNYEIKIKLSTIAPLGVILMLPISETLTKFLLNTTQDKINHISTTERERGLSSSRFSEAIDFIENDSESDLDIIYFLPSGSMGDLVLRSKMRTLAMHFAGSNLAQVSPFKTSKALNIYIAYDKELSDLPKFIEATTKKFPNSELKNEVLKGSIIIKKIRIHPTSSVS